MFRDAQHTPTVGKGRDEERSVHYLGSAIVEVFYYSVELGREAAVQAYRSAQKIIGVIGVVAVVDEPVIVIMIKGVCHLSTQSGSL